MPVTTTTQDRVDQQVQGTLLQYRVDQLEAKVGDLTESLDKLSRGYLEMNVTMQEREKALTARYTLITGVITTIITVIGGVIVAYISLKGS